MSRLARINLKTLPKGILLNSINNSIKFANNYSTTCFKKNNNKITNLVSVKNYSTSTIVLTDNNNSTDKPDDTLDPVEYKSWTKEEVCSLLCAKTDNGGAGLSLEQVKPLYDAGFDGASLAYIVQNLEMEKNDKSTTKSLMEKRKEVVGFTHNKWPTASFYTISTVVFWVDNLLKTRFYHLWTTDEVKQHLGKFCDELGLSNKDITKLAKYVLKSQHSDAQKIEIQKYPSILSWVSNLQTVKYNLIFEKEVLYNPQHFYNNSEMDKKHLSLFSKEDLIYLYKVSQLQIESLQKPLKADPFKFDLKNRDVCIEMITQGIKRYYSNYKNKTTLAKQDIPFILAKGGSGSGKSRILVESINIIRNINDDVFKRTRLIYYNFTNGFNLQTTQRDENLVAMITSRIIYSSFKDALNLASAIPVHGVDDKKLLHEVLYIISKKLHEEDNIKMNFPIPIILAFDEFQMATRSFPKLGTNIQHLISWYIRTLQKEHGLLIIPAFGGTLTSTDIEFTPTDHLASLIDLSLPCLREEDTESIVIKHDKLKPYYSKRSKLIWDVIGCVPRHLEWAIRKGIDFVTSTPHTNVDTLMNNIYGSVANQVFQLYMYFMDNPSLKRIALICLSGFPLSIFSNEMLVVESLKQKGLIYEKDGKPQLPLVMMGKLDPTFAVILENFVMSKKPEHEKFEEIILQTLMCRFTLLFENSSEVEFKNLFRGAIYPSTIGKAVVTVNNKNSSYSFGTLDHSVSNSDCSDTKFQKTKAREFGVDGISCNMKLTLPNSHQEEAIIVTQAKLQEENSKDESYGPGDIALFYEKALKVNITTREKYVLLVTNKQASNATKDMISDEGCLTYVKDKVTKVLPCPKLMLIDRSCFPNFFNSFFADFLTTFINRDGACLKN
ncbi:hypothetical protein ABK040_005935 [Willaertia magna]